MNSILEEQTYKLKKAVLALETSGKVRTYNNIQLKEAIENEIYGSAVEQSSTLNNFFLEIISSKRKVSTKEIYEHTRRKIEMFGGLLLTFNDINIQWLRRFESSSAEVLSAASISTLSPSTSKAMV